MPLTLPRTPSIDTTNTSLSASAASTNDTLLVVVPLTNIDTSPASESDGALVGGIVGGIAAFFLVVCTLTAVYLTQNRRRRDQKANEIQVQEPSDSPNDSQPNDSQPSRNYDRVFPPASNFNERCAGAPVTVSRNNYNALLPSEI